MQQHRVIPSLLLVSLALAGSACTATSIESAAATDRATAVEAAGDRDPATPAVTPPMPPTSVAPDSVAPVESPRVTTVDVATTGDVASTVDVSPTVDVASTVDAPATSDAPATTVEVTTHAQREPVATIAPVLAAGPCDPVGPIPESAAAVSVITLDTTGDGTADDTATSYLNGDTGEWVLRLVTTAGAVSELVIGGVGPGFVEALGAVEFGGNGAESFLATVGSSASGLRVGVFGADDAGCLLRRGGDGVEFVVGGTVGAFSGVRCGSWNGGHYLESLGADEVGPGSYNLYGTTWHLDDAGELFAENGTHLFGATFDDVEAIATIDCAGIEL